MAKKQENRDISVIVGIFVQNEKGEILFGRMPKWGDRWAVFGGHVERGESIEEAAMRELKEESGLDADKLEFMNYSQIIDSSQFYKKKHFIGFDFKYNVEGRPKIEINDEFTEVRWMTIDEALEQDDLNALTVQSLERMKIKGCSKCEEYKSGWQRAQADYQNLQREVEQKRSEWVALSELQILEEFIPVYDNFKKAFNVQIDQNVEDVQNDKWREGIGFIMKQFGDVLKSHGIEEIRTVGEEFSPELHEAVGEEESDEDEGVIIREIESGYKMKDRILKASKVIISKK